MRSFLLQRFRESSKPHESILTVLSLDINDNPAMYNGNAEGGGWVVAVEGRLWRISMSVREDLHRLVDELPECEIHAAKRYLEYLRNMGDPVLRSLMEAPIDDEPTTPQEDKGAEEAWREYLQGKSRPWQEVREELASE